MCLLAIIGALNEKLLMSLENLCKICLNLSLLIVSFILINLLRNVQIVDDTKIKLPGTVNGTETELSHMAFFAKAVDWEALVL